MPDEDMSHTPEYGGFGSDTERAKELKDWIDEAWTEIIEERRS
jgi:hypothetical protein